MLRTAHWLYALDSRNLLFTDVTREGFLTETEPHPGLNPQLHPTTALTAASGGSGSETPFCHPPNHHPAADPVPSTT